mgnify:CR=1 FL=1
MQAMLTGKPPNVAAFAPFGGVSHGKQRTLVEERPGSWWLAGG